MVSQNQPVEILPTPDPPNEVTLGGDGDLRELSRNLKNVFDHLQIEFEHCIEEDAPEGLILFLVGKERIWAHLEVAYHRSQRVKSMFDTRTGDQNTRFFPLTVKNGTLTGVKCCVEFMYTGECKFRGHTGVARDILRAAVELGVDDLVKLCAEFILNHSEVTSLWGHLQTGLTWDCESLVTGCLERIAQNAGQSFDVPDMHNVVTSVGLLKVLKRHDLAIEENLLARKVLANWVTRTKEKEEETTKVLRHICWDQVQFSDTEFWSTLASEGMDKSAIDLHDQVKEWKAAGELKTHRCCKCAFQLVSKGQRVSRYFAVKLQNTELEDVSYTQGTSPCIKNGTSAEVTSDHGELDATPAFTVEAWVRFSEEDNKQPSQSVVVSKHGKGTGWELRASSRHAEFLITLRNPGNRREVWREIVKRDISDSDGTNWVHLVGSFDGKTSKVYVGGSCNFMRRRREGTYSVPDDITQDAEIVSYSGSMRIGTNAQCNDRRFCGDVCGVRVYTDRVLEPPFLN